MAKRKVKGLLDEIEIIDIMEDAKTPIDMPALERKTKTLPVRYVRLDAIVEESSLQTRGDDFNPETIPRDKELLESIRANGVLQPIKVQQAIRIRLGENKKQTYQTVFGHRRISAARRWAQDYGGPDVIIAMIEPYGVDRNAQTIAENRGTLQLTSYETAAALDMFSKENPDMKTQEAISKATGVERTIISRLLQAYNDSPDPLLILFKNGMGTRTVLLLQTLFEKVNDVDHSAFAAMVSDISRTDAQRIKKAIDNGFTPRNALREVNIVFNDPVSKSVVSQAPGIERVPESEQAVSQTPGAEQVSVSKQKGTGYVFDPDDKNDIKRYRQIVGNLSLKKTSQLLLLTWNQEYSADVILLAGLLVVEGGRAEINHDLLEISRRMLASGYSRTLNPWLRSRKNASSDNERFIKGNHSNDADANQMQKYFQKIFKLASSKR